MKTILVGVAVAALLALPLSAPSQASEGPSYSRAYPQKKHLPKHLGTSYRGLDGFSWNSDQPASNAAPMKDGLCSTAPEFCPDYHGSNGA
jgi:hypothetical protein